MKEPPAFGDAEAKRIIQRAAEIDSQQKLDANALREIAAEAGISPASVDRALEEHLQERPALRARLLRRPGLWIAAAIIGFFFFMRLFP